MKKLKLSIEELAVETFDVDVARNAWEGTVEGQADPRTYTSPAPDDCPCTIPSQGQDRRHVRPHRRGRGVRDRSDAVRRCRGDGGLLRTRAGGRSPLS